MFSYQEHRTVACAYIMFDTLRNTSLNGNGKANALWTTLLYKYTVHFNM